MRLHCWPGGANEVLLESDRRGLARPRVRGVLGYCGSWDGWPVMTLLEELERDRCLELALDLIERGPGHPCSPGLADGYSSAAQQLACEILRGEEVGLDGE